MPDQIPSRSTKQNTIPGLITSLLLALLLLAVSLVPYAALVRWISQILSDGTFESLSSGEYQVLQWLIRGIALLLLAISASLAFWPARTQAARLKLKAALARIHIRQELRSFFRSTFPAEDRFYWLALAVITLLGLAVRLVDYLHPVGYDEAYTYIHFASKSLRMILADYSAPNNHIFHTLLVALADRFFGNHLWVLRLPALIAGVLCVPAAYMAGKSLYGRAAGSLAAAFIAVSPLLVDYSNNARGYSLVCLFSLLMLWQAGWLQKNSTFTSWYLLSAFAVLGFYTIPTMIYPVSGIYLWLLLSWLFHDTGQSNRWHFVSALLASAASTILVTLLLYTPVFLFGTGLSSITGNEFVQSQTWGDFVQSIAVRIPTVWADWNALVPPGLSIFIIVGMAAAVLLAWRRAAHRLPLWLVVLLAVSILLVVQRVAPLTRVWLFLLCFYLLFSAAGWQMLLGLVTRQRALPRVFQILALLLLVLGVFWGYWSARAHYLNSDPDTERYRAPAQFAASILQPADTLVAVSPISIQVGYYLTQEGVPFSRYFDKVRRGEIQHAIVILSTHSKFPTVQAVAVFQLLDNTLDTARAELLFERGYLQVYSVPVLAQP
jgi:hypothetical protein